MDQTRILIVDDHAIVREGLCRLLASQPDLDVVAEAGDGDEAIRIARDTRLDIVLMDIGMPQVNGIDATRTIKGDSDEPPKVLILTAHEDRNLLRLALAAGADGYLLKNSNKDKLAGAIRDLLSQGVYFEPELDPDGPGSAAGLPGPTEFSNLTKREREIFSLVAQGLKNREISEQLHISIKTVEKHRANLMRKLGLHSVAELVSCALKAGFLMRGGGDVA
ncbi:response regulator [Desulfohalovibrio reitneri]|uniref:response regulator n=1 Tax=Desulfohalovibrio reitneri TaxID=1307759 RepID=UPI0004A70F8B|nr:response regulator transcription factor [Desulfohalovibrio reitneri]